MHFVTISGGEQKLTKKYTTEKNCFSLTLERQNGFSDARAVELFQLNTRTVESEQWFQLKTTAEEWFQLNTRVEEWFQLNTRAEEWFQLIELKSRKNDFS